VLRVEVADEWGKLEPDAEQQVVRSTADGSVDLAWVGTRVFDTLGVTSLQALTAPLLVDSYPLEKAVLASDLPGQMLAGLEPAGVTGLAVLAGGLRRPMAVRAPLLGPADWHGRTIQTFRSTGQSETIKALGATPTDVGPEGRDAGLESGQIHGFENSLQIYGINGMQARAPYVAANVVLWPETAALLVNPDRLAGLSATQQRWLREAAADAAVQSSELVARDADIVEDLCRGGARFATATAAQLGALRDAVRPVYTRLRQDPRTTTYLERIDRLKADTPAVALTVPAGCTGTPAPSPTPAAGDPSGLNGVYRLEWTVNELMAAGRPQHDAEENAGIITLTFDDGKLVWNWQGSQASNCVGRYVVSGDRVGLISGSGAQWPCGGPGDWDKEHFTAAWKATDKQLVLTDIRSTGQFAADQNFFEVLFGGKPWARIG
jgi:TRAP-type C4-dicarboxylate transport system substrate-binding protein